MIYTFMNKDVGLFDVEMDEGIAESVSNFREEVKHLLPIGLMQHPNRQGIVNRKQFREWWRGRQIPASRIGVKELWENFQRLGENMHADWLAERAFGLSLSDQYWLKPNPEIKWEDINFFTNDFSEDIGRILIENPWLEDIDARSPDNTSDGYIRKRWKIINGKRVLIKGSSSSEVIQPQPFRELFVSELAEKLFEPENVPFQKVVKYTVEQVGGRSYSLCENFITPDTEYVSWNQLNTAFLWQKANHQSHLDWCKRFYKTHKRLFDLLLILDYIVLNEDRHFGNFGFVRCTYTGELLYPAPIFDTGNCLFYDNANLSIIGIKSKPFYSDFEKQIKRVVVGVYKENLAMALTYIKDIFHHSFRNSFESEERKENLLRIMKSRITALVERKEY